MSKRLTRDIDNKMIGGVCAGFAKYFGHDVTWWRLGYVVVTVLTGFMPFIIAYLIAWIIVPPDDGVTYVVNE